MTDPSDSVTYYPFSSLLQSPATGHCAAAGALCVQVEMSAQCPVYNTTPLTTVGCTNVQLRIPASPYDMLNFTILIDNA